MTSASTAMSDAAHNLREELKKHDRQFGMIGYGVDCLTVFAHQSKSWWGDRAVSKFHGVPVEWHFDCGMPEAL